MSMGSLEYMSTVNHLITRMAGIAGAVTAVVWLSTMGSLVQAATLEKFTMSTAGNGQQLVVKLQTDADTTAKVEYGAKGAIVHLKDATLSPAMVEAGLPMVMDENNRFIGRAVPGGEGGGVKLVIPNVRPGDVQLQVQQVRQLQAIGSIEPLQAQPEAVGQFRAAANAAQASLNKVDTPPALPRRAPPKAIAARPVVKQPTRMPVTTPSSTTSVTLKPQVVPYKAANTAKKTRMATTVARTKTRRLPKVVSLSSPVEAAKPTATVATVPATEQASPQQKTGYSADTSWFSDDELPTVAGNDYGVLAVPSVATAPPEPHTSSIFSGLASFLDNVSGNLFSRPYGLAFWGLMLGVVLFGALGFVLLAVGVYLFRVSLRATSSASAPQPETSPSSTNSRYQGNPQRNLPYGATVDKYSNRPSPQRPSPFATMRQARAKGASAFQAIMPVLQSRGSLRERLRAVGMEQPSGATSTARQEGLRARLKSTSSTRGERSGTRGVTSPMPKPALQPLAGRLPVGAGVGGGHAQSPRATGAATVKDAVSSVLKWI